MREMHEMPESRDLYTQLFVKLTTQRLIGGFAFLHFATGKLPEVPHRLRLAPIGNKDLSLAGLQNTGDNMQSTLY